FALSSESIHAHNMLVSYLSKKYENSVNRFGHYVGRRPESSMLKCLRMTFRCHVTGSKRLKSTLVN
ncbi:MAG: hypothetical protein WBL49_05980, partial [Nitrososphaeraceae archaeon]